MLPDSSIFEKSSGLTLHRPYSVIRILKNVSDVAQWTSLSVLIVAHFSFRRCFQIGRIAKTFVGDVNDILKKENSAPNDN